MRWIRTVLWMAAFLFAILFSFQNREEVILRLSFFPVWSHEWESPRVPLFLVILCSIFLGVFIGGIGDLYRRVQLKKTLRQNEKTIERLEREIESSRIRHVDSVSFPK
jgi:uncharacterized integral membrane protein